ncbi:MAG: tetratricopeptide repeat protein [Candidatus Kapaibacterium sp.]
MTRSPFLLSVALLICGAAVLDAQPAEENQRYRLAQGYEQSGDLKSAARVFRELYDADHQSNVYFQGVLRTYTGLLRFDELLPIVQDRASHFPRDVDIRALYANILHRNHRPEEAIKEWAAATEIQPDQEFAWSLVAQSQLDVQLYDLAAKTYTQARARLGDAGLFGEQMAQLYAVTGKYEEATNEYLNLLSTSAARIGSIKNGMGFYTVNPRGADAAIAVINKRLQSIPDFPPYLDLLAWLYTEKRDYDGALDVVKKIDQIRKGNGSDIYAFADAALSDERYDAAINALEYFQRTYPATNALHGSVVLAYAHALEGRFHALPAHTKSDVEGLIGRYMAIVKENPGTASAAEALLQVAKLQAYDLNEVKDGIATLNRLEKEYPKAPSLEESAFLLGEFYLRDGDLEKADDRFATGIRASEDEHIRDLSMLRRGEILFYRGRFARADSLFAELARNIGGEAANDALEYRFMLQENMGKNDSTLAHYAAGTFALLRNAWKDAAREMDLSVAAGKNGSLADDALLGKAKAQEELGDAGDAVATLLGVVKDYADGTVADQALFHAGEISEGKLADKPKAIELYTRLLTEYPASSYVVRARARIRALRGES